MFLSSYFSECFQLNCWSIAGKFLDYITKKKKSQKNFGGLGGGRGYKKVKIPCIKFTHKFFKPRGHKVEQQVIYKVEQQGRTPEVTTPAPLGCSK